MIRPANMPNVTVVTIFLNAEAFIAEAIDSVLAQSYHDFELILVDDGSTDSSTAIAKQYASQYPQRVRYTEHEGHRNLGMSASRNHGVDMARGRFISFLDADDLWLADRLRRYVAAIEAHDEAGMVYGPTLYWYSWRDADDVNPPLTEQKDFPGWLALPTETLIQPPGALRKWLETGGACLPGMNSLIVRREAFDGVSGFETQFRGLYEDQAFLSKMAAKYPVVVIPEVLDYYRQHPDSCCHRGIETGDYHPELLHPARRRYLFWLEEYLRQRGMRDRTLLRALHRELWPYRSRINGALYTAARTAPRHAKKALRRWLPPIALRGLRRIKRKLERLDQWLRRSAFLI